MNLNIKPYLYKVVIAVQQGLKRLVVLFASGMECWVVLGMWILGSFDDSGTIEAKEAKDLLKFYTTSSLSLTSLLVACVALVKEDIKKSNDLKNMVIRCSCFLTTFFGLAALTSERILIVVDSLELNVSALSTLREIFSLTVLSMLFLILAILKTTIDRKVEKDKTSWSGDRKIVNMKGKKRLSIIDKIFNKNI